MKVLIFGATGMVGQGVLRECLRAPDVEAVQTVGRTRSGQLDPRLIEVIQQDLTDIRAIEPSLNGFDACFLCLGVSSAGMQEAEYSRLTYDLTMAVAQTLARLNPQMTFVYVSGSGTDGTEHGRSMWARVKGRTENALRRLPFKGVYLFRPGVIEPLNGARSKTRSYRLFYTLAKPFLPTLRALLPNQILSTEDIGLAMLAVARQGADKAVLETADIRALSRSASRPVLGLHAG
ncbi:NAD-dependent epimerase/dehydratase family protein [Paraburkholderia dioscoreae]|uniref:Putative nucleoside-diphosphate sugar epimerase n=1 Tax=Paraburkholderia dioscoreae TaxID=2604047 RepID=A0A5Q4Z1H7_9BURK|nr:NAD-dependent epimerase/dehydratase family protein [Paraburkholderia dioscoreae]VVD26700.1 putative nucleoside-diphosphate sugar epimerase [Paraburkholderia dioscoreae]